MDMSVPTSSRRRSVLYVSFVVSLVALLIGAVVIGLTAEAANYTIFLSGSQNWTAGGWSCSTTGPTDSCGTYPGQLPNPGGDVANITTSGGPGTVVVSSAITNPVQLTATGFATPGVNITGGGALTLRGASTLNPGQLQITGGTLNVPSGASLTASSSSTLSLFGGTLNNAGLITLQGALTTAAQMNWSGGTISGGGTLQISSPGDTTKASLSATGTSGAMILDNVVVNNNGTIGFSSPTNPLTLANNAQINILAGAQFNTTTDGTIGSGAGTGQAINNSGTFSKTGGAGNTTVNVPFNNAGTVSIPGSTGGIAFNAGGTQSGAFNTLGVGNPLTFAATVGQHQFNAGATFSGAGPVTFGPGNVVLAMGPSGMSIPGALTNNGNLIFGGANTTFLTLGSSFTQGGSGALSMRVNGPTNTQYDYINATTTATLAGNLTESLGFAPTDGQTFNILTYASHTGAFTYTPVPYANGVLLLNYLPTVAQLVAAPQADVGLVKTGPSSVPNGQSFSYTIKVGNAGPSPATSITVTDSWTGPAQFVSGSVPGGTCSGGPTGPVTCTIPSVAVGASVFITLNYTATGLGTVTNTASVTSSPGDPNSANDVSSATTTVTPSADLNVQKIGPSTVAAGAPLTYTLNVTNGGPDAAPNVTVLDTLPPGLTGVTATAPAGWTCTPSSTTVTCTTSSLAVTGPTPVIITINATAPTAAGTITNTVSISSSGSSDPLSGNNSASAVTTVTAAADIGITKSGPATVTAGQNVTYTYNVVNNGPSNVTNLQVSDTPGPGLTFVSATAPCAAFPCNIGTLNAGNSLSFSATYSVDPSATGSVTNTATASASGVTDANSSNDNSTTTAVVVVNADVGISKSGPANVSPGGTLTYTILVKNFGPSTATSIQVNDPTPAQTTFNSLTASAGTCSSFPCTIGSLLPNSTVTFTSTYTVANSATGTITNTASKTSTNDTNSVNDASTTTATVVPTADLAIQKTAPASFFAGAPVTFTITIKNLGPSSATNIQVNDTPSAGLTFVSNSGACTTPFPCTIASLPSGGTTTISSTYNVASGVTSVSNTATVSSTSVSDTNSTNNSSTVTRTTGPSCPNAVLVQFTPFSGQTDAPLSGKIEWTDIGASQYQVFMGPAGSGCATSVGTVTGTSFSYSGLSPNTDYESHIVAVRPGCPSVGSQCIRWRTAAAPCNITAPTLQQPGAGTTVGSPTTLRWSDVGAASYHVIVMVNGKTEVDTTTSNTFLDVNLPNGVATWSVTAISGNCSAQSGQGTFTTCAPPAAPIAGVVGAPSSGHEYSVIVVNANLLPAVQFEYQEASDESFTKDLKTQLSQSPTMPYSHTTDRALVFFYRVRAIGGCTNTPGPYSRTIRVVIVPNVVQQRNPNVNVPAGSKDLVVVQVQIPGDATKVNFTATSDRPWIVKIEPSSGILPPEGIALNVFIDPSQLPNGTFTATVIVTTTPTTSNGRIVTNGNNTNKSVPVSINLITPVVPVSPTGPTADSLIIPAVGHAQGLNSQWRSDIRIYNASPQTLQYLLNFKPQGSDEVKQTTITTLSGETTALDDIIHNWYGVGEVGDSQTGVLEIRPMTTDGSTTPPQGSSFLTIASSRTFNATNEGTVGQFIPPVKFTNFIGNGSRLSLQQLAQSSSYRTNFGLVEASGSPVNLILSMFNDSGAKLFDLPVALNGGEQKLLNGLLAQQGVNINDGRLEVKVAGGDGKVTAYASVIDNQSEDPQLVPGQNLSNTSSKLYVVPGVADLNNGAASWRSDMRIYNSGNAPQTMTLTFFSQGNVAAPQSTTVTVNPNEVKALDNLVQSVFGKTNVGGMVQLTTPTDSQLVVTARTYNQTATGTLGQFIKAATAADGITTASRALNILQVEDSPRFRTNVGLAEMSGKPATVQVSVVLPDSKVTPSIEVPLGANEFRQFSVADFGLGNIYNARVSVKVVDGQGSVTAYGSVIDQVTTDPTYVQAQQ